MADRETKAQRREAARKARIEAQRKAARRKQMRRVYGLAVVVLIAAVIGGAVWLGGKSKRDQEARLNSTLAEASGFTKVQSPPSEGAGHLTSEEEQAQVQVDYQTEPPTSGKHSGSRGPAPTGVHSTAVEDEAFVHNLEHGHVVIVYDADRLEPTIIDALEAWARDNDTRALITPRPELAEQDFPLAVAAWAKFATAEDPTTPEAVVDFVDAFYNVHVGKGPEGNIPGTPNE